MADADSSPETKTCTKCGETKPIESFGLEERGYRQGHRRAQCNQCRYRARAERSKAYNRAWYQQNKTHTLLRNKGWREAHPEHMQALYKDYRHTHKEERQAANKAWCEAHKEKRRADNKTWRDQNKERVQATNKAWNEANKDERRLYSHTYSSTHKVQRAHNQRKRNTLKRLLPDTFAHEDEQFCRQYFHFACAACEQEESFDFTLAIDHWIPLSSPACPGATALNMVVLCHGQRGCNNSKGNKDPETWLIHRFGARKARAILTRIAAYFAVVQARQDTTR